MHEGRVAPARVKVCHVGRAVFHMRIAQTYLEQLGAEVRQLNRQAAAADRSGQADEAERLRVEATAKQTKLARLQGQRNDGVRFG